MTWRDLDLLWLGTPTSRGTVLYAAAWGSPYTHLVAFTPLAATLWRRRLTHGALTYDP